MTGMGITHTHTHIKTCISEYIDGKKKQ